MFKWRNHHLVKETWQVKQVSFEKCAIREQDLILNIQTRKGLLSHDSKEEV